MKGYPRSLIYIYFAGTVLAFVWIFLNFATWCQDDDEVELLRKKLQLIQHKSDTERKLISNLEHQLEVVEQDVAKQCSGSRTIVKGVPMIYLITPTHGRLEQKADLTRLSHTLRHVPNIHWVVVEDAAQKSALVSKFLQSCTLSYTHLNVKTPDAVKLKESDPNWLKPRGVLQRNAGLQWVRTNAQAPAVLYFADDDNTYDLQVFEEVMVKCSEVVSIDAGGSNWSGMLLCCIKQSSVQGSVMRHTKKVSVWPVGLVGYLRYESPVVKHGKVVGWYTYWKPKRAFAMDMAGFAVNVQLLHAAPQALFRVSAGRGNQESDLLTQLGVHHNDLEPRADNCTKILVWHTRTEKSSLKNEEKMLKIYGYNSDTNIEV